MLLSSGLDPLLPLLAMARSIPIERVLARVIQQTTSPAPKLCRGIASIRKVDRIILKQAGLPCCTRTKTITAMFLMR